MVRRPRYKPEWVYSASNGVAVCWPGAPSRAYRTLVLHRGGGVISGATMTLVPPCRTPALGCAGTNAEPSAHLLHCEGRLGGAKRGGFAHEGIEAPKQRVEVASQFGD